jgi:hypothetical protein
MLAVASIEAAVAGRMGVRLPFGHSTMILARKVIHHRGQSNHGDNIKEMI